MALMSSRATQDNLMVPRRLQEQQLVSKLSGERKVPVVYYLCRNGQLDHPHFIEVSLNSHCGLYLRDVINRLNDLRGKGMACLYSWSSKRLYKNGFVWQDLSEDDVIFPVHGQEYVLKGSQLLNFDNSGTVSDFPAVVTHRCNRSLSSIDLSEYKVYKTSESTSTMATDAATQTDDHRRKKKPTKKEEEEETSVNEITELSREEIVSPPQSESSPQTLETLLKAEGRLILRPEEDKECDRTVEILPSGKLRASTVLMRMISCGATSFKECWPTLMSGNSMCTIERGTGKYRLERAEKELRSFGRVKLEEKEYFSCSLIDESKKELVPALKRSSSYNTDRSSRMG